MILWFSISRPHPRPLSQRERGDILRHALHILVRTLRYSPIQPRNEVRYAVLADI